MTGTRPPTISELLARIRAAEEELEAEFEVRRARFAYHIERRRVIFEAEVRRRHRALRAALLPYLLGVRLRVLLTAPVIYALIVPIALLDLCVSLYQAICFPAYGIAKVRRRDHVVIDRHHLAYLNGVEKLNCVYCGYANGVIAFAREVAARTEQYWCPIKHALRVVGPHGRYAGFTDYGDAEGYREGLDRLREALAGDGRAAEPGPATRT